MSPASVNKLDVSVVGVGACTSVGASAPASAAAVRAGLAMVYEHPCVIDREGEPFVVARAPYLSDDLPFENRFVELALPAALEALRPLAKIPGATRTIPTMVGLPSPRPGLPPNLAGVLSQRMKELNAPVGRLAKAQFLANGHSAGLMALEAGCRLLQDGAAVFCLIGGVDSTLHPDTLEWIEDCEQLHKPANAWGFIPGEAAGFCLLCAGTTAERHGVPVLGRVMAVATSQEENRIKTKTVCLGNGLTEVVRKVLPAAAAAGPIIDWIICDQNGEAYRADEFGFLMARTGEWFRNGSDFLAPADCWGDVGAASGPLFVTLATFAASKGYAPGPHTLIWTSSEGGERSAAIFSANVKTERWS
jgi:3-oxoacyl-[acyl-carrier-protein] synthase I